LKLIDRYILRLTLWPLAGALGATLAALLLERVLRLLQLLSQSSNRFGFVAELAANLIPHYLGLTLPAAFFIALFVVVTRLSEGSEIDALLASGVSLTRVTAPYLGLATVLTLISLVLFGYLQPYSRYGYRAVLHTAQTAGWSGQAEPQTFFAPDPSLTMTADTVDPTGQQLGRIFIRKVLQDGREQITTAARGQLSPDPDGRQVTLALTDGQQLSATPTGSPRVLAFKSFNLSLPMSSAQKLLRQRGVDARELTLNELAHAAAQPNPVIPRQALLGELYARLARAFALPLLPLLAVPLGLAAKRGGRAPGIMLAGVLLLAFQHLIQLGQSFATNGRAIAAVSVGAPFFGFALICIFTFVSSRKRPGETPVSLLSDRVSEGLARLNPRGRKPAGRAS
jgi:lipopolysaccharide export system permease protein